MTPNRQGDGRARIPPGTGDGGNVIRLAVLRRRLRRLGSALGWYGLTAEDIGRIVLPEVYGRPPRHRSQG